MTESDYAGKSAYRGPVAANYDRDRMAEPLWAVEQEYVARWAAGLKPGETVLDLPAGTGRFLEILFARQARVVAMDVSDDMLAELRKRPAAAHAGVVIARGDVEHLALADQSVDYVLCWRLFHLLPLDAVTRALAEFRRVCRQQILVQVLPVRAQPSWWRGPDVLRRVLRPLRQVLRPRPRTPWAHIPSRIHVESELLTRFAHAGLETAAVETIAHYDGLPVRVYTLHSTRR